MSRAAAAVARTSPEVLLLRLAVLVAGGAAVLVAAPSGLPAGLLGAGAVLAVLPALWPRGPWVTALVLAAAAGWLAGTGVALLPGLSGAAGTGPVPVVPERLLLLAGLLYLVHTLAALVATLPYDAALAPDVVARWLLRAAGVLLVSSLLSVGVLVGLDRAVDGRTYLAATLAGLAVTAALTTYFRLIMKESS